MQNIKEFYKKDVVPKLVEQFNYENIMSVPKVTKITLNIGVGDISDKQVLKHAVDDLTRIAGQKAVITKARKSEAGFKIREGWNIGCMVTLRGKRMHDFLERLLYIGLPRIRDFRGLNPRSFDGRGNFSMGIKEQIVFPEIEYEKVDKLRGLDVCVTTTANTNEEGLALLTLLNFPFKDARKA